MDSQGDLKKLGEEKVEIGKDLIERLSLFKNISGINKIRKKISTEIGSLQNVM